MFKPPIAQHLQLQERHRCWSDGNRKRVSKLTTLVLFQCDNVTDAGLIEIGRGCSNLQSLDLTYCKNITDATLIEIGKGCPKLQSLDLSGCYRINDACKTILMQSHPQLELELESERQSNESNDDY